MCDAKCSMERKIYSKELLRSGKSLLASIGLEQVSLRTAGPRYWKAFNSAVKATIQASGEDWTPSSCPWCSNGNPKEETSNENKMLSSKIFDFQQNKLDPVGILNKSEASSITSQPLNFDHIFKIEPPKDRSSILTPPLMPPYFSTGITPFSSDMRSSLNSLYSWPSANQMPPVFNYPTSTMKFKSEADMIQQRMTQWQQLMSMHFNMLQLNSKPTTMEQSSANHLSVPSFNPTPKCRSPTGIKSKSPITTVTIEDDDMPLDLSISNKRRSENGSVAKSELYTPEPDEQDIKGFSPASLASEISTKVYSMNKKNYSQADLDAAVTDIRCGRLGTRRASVVYGIPRSTLRNKIYKLEAAEDNNGEGASKRRRLNAYATRKKEKEPTKLEIKPENGPIENSNITLSDSLETTQTMSPLAMNAATPPAMSPFVMSTPSMLPSLSSLSNLLKRYVENSGGGGENNALINGNLGENTSSDEMEMKKARPKRGQYRKYDKTALDKAVASVRKGEMSVHRAGSFYGVPHSTLEYKVKERNLLRNKRRNPSETANTNINESNITETGELVETGDLTRESNSLEPTESVASNTSTSDS